MRKEQIPIDRKVTLDELNSLITHEDNSRVLKRLYFIKFRYLGDTQRLWLFKKPLMIKNTDYIKANAFDFYSLNGNNLIEFKDCSKAENVCEFPEKIVKENKTKNLERLSVCKRV